MAAADKCVGMGSLWAPTCLSTAVNPLRQRRALKDKPLAVIGGSAGPPRRLAGTLEHLTQP